MKGRESGMPEEDYWDSFFDVDLLFETLIANHLGRGDVAEFGSGYGTFTIPVARKISGVVYAFDIEPTLVSRLNEKCKGLGISNVQVEQRDFLEQGTGLPSESVEHAMIYNILHIEHPIKLLQEAFRILKPGGTASIIHWRRDIPTPRGPSMEIRPGIEQCQDLAVAAGFVLREPIDISNCCQYHYGLLLARPESSHNHREPGAKF
jgi:SAM-dependent methyltransferase